MRNERVLVVGAHCDDESFGVLGTLLKHKKQGDTISFLWFTEARNTLTGALQAAHYFDAFSDFLNYADQRLDLFALTELIRPIEDMLMFCRPTVVYMPFIGDLNKDHRLVSEATMVACRPYKANAPTEVWMYEIPGSTEYGLQKFRRDLSLPVDALKKFNLLEKWYPKELRNGRETVPAIEHFQKWPMK